VKLIIQIPCYNEEATLAIALAALPRQVPGFEVVEWLIIDDGCTDRTVDVALECGVDHVVRMKRNSGLAKVFMAGIDACLRLGADVIVNTDADNQYCADDIPLLTQPVLDGTADIVIGARPIGDIEHFSAAKKLLQNLGSWAVRGASKTDIPDAPSGFRAMSRSAAMRLNVFSEYTYTIETIIQAGQKGMAITSVPIRVNEDLRPSRLVKSIWSYVRRSILTIGSVFLTYRPVASFIVPGAIVTAFGTLISLRFLYFYFAGKGGGHIQSLILAAVLMLMGFMLIVFGFVAELLGVNRKLLEEIQWRVRRLEMGLEPEAPVATPSRGERGD